MENEQLTPDAYAHAIQHVRAEKDAFFGEEDQSPIPEEEREAFSGLRYFPPDLAYRVEAEVVPYDEQKVVMLGRSRGDVGPQLRFAEVRFTLNGQDVHLTAFKDADDPDADDLFVPFRDATSGKETYGAGRYIETQADGPDGSLRATLDFNLAYNPWCNYSEAYTCILPPAENTLPVAVRAGEMTYGAGH